MRHVQTPTFVMRPCMRCPALRRDKAATVPKTTALQRVLEGGLIWVPSLSHLQTTRLKVDNHSYYFYLPCDQHFAQLSRAWITPVLLSLSDFFKEGAAIDFR